VTIHWYYIWLAISRLRTVTIRGCYTRCLYTVTIHGYYIRLAIFRLRTVTIHGYYTRLALHGDYTRLLYTARYIPSMDGHSHGDYTRLLYTVTIHRYYIWLAISRLWTATIRGCYTRLAVKGSEEQWQLINAGWLWYDVVFGLS